MSLPLILAPDPPLANTRAEHLPATQSEDILREGGSLSQQQTLSRLTACNSKTKAGRIAASGRPAVYWREQGISNIRDTSNGRRASKLGTRTEAEVVSETPEIADTVQ